MGFFGNSTTITQIHREVGFINDFLRKMERSIEQNNGIYESNAEQMSEWFLRTVQHQQNMQNMLNTISPKEESKLNLVWMDGRYLPFYMWNSSYTIVMTQIQQGLNNIIERLGI